MSHLELLTSILLFYLFLSCLHALEIKLYLSAITNKAVRIDSIQVKSMRVVTKKNKQKTNLFLIFRLRKDISACIWRQCRQYQQSWSRWDHALINIHLRFAAWTYRQLLEMVHFGMISSTSFANRAVVTWKWGVNCS